MKFCCSIIVFSCRF